MFQIYQKTFLIIIQIIFIVQQISAKSAQKPSIAEESKKESSIEIDCENLDLINFVPVKEVSSILTNAIRYDPEARSTAIYLQSGEFHHLMARLLHMMQKPPLLPFVSGIGLQFADVMDQLGQTMKGQSMNEIDTKNLVEENQGETGVGNVIRKIVSVLPTNEIKHCYNMKLNPKPAFQHVVDQVNAPAIQEAFNDIRKTEPFQTLSSRLQDRGLEVNKLLGQAMNFFGLDQEE